MWENKLLAKQGMMLPSNVVYPGINGMFNLCIRYWYDCNLIQVLQHLN
jgi:hypothetical protein